MSRFLFSLLILVLLTTAERIPREMKWASDTYGPDGPWRAIEVLMGGSDPSPISLYPGSTWESWLIEDEHCRNGACYASRAGTYDKTLKPQDSISFQAGINDFMLGMDVRGDDGVRWMDDMMMNGVQVKNISLALLVDQKIRYPSGYTLPMFAGCLSLGGPGAINQSFSQPNGPATNASLPPGWLYENDWTPSNSFGMHIGSVQPSMAGSLWYGGYDENRVVGDILTMNGNPREGITLRDISIDVIRNTSNLFIEPEDGLLAKGNSSIGSGLKVLVDGCSPYLTLPKSTCDSITANLPVSFDEGLGLYFWNTDSDDYKDIIPSATALTFSFISDSNTEPVKIHVPFMHLNLTLSAPLVANPTPYFPCHVNNKGQYVLGRAFLQDAFLGANWDPDANKWWLAQAPGRNIQATSNVVKIEPTDKTISKGGNDWKASWSGIWVDTEDESPASTPKPSPTKEAETPKVEQGMSIGMKAGIGAGVAFAAVILGIVVFLLWRRRKNQATPAPMTEAPPGYTTDHYKPPVHQYLPPQEMPAHEAQSDPSPYRRYELPS